MDVVHRHFSRSYRNHDKDVILFENGKLNVYIATLEIVRLSDGKKLIGIRILKLHSFDPVKDGFSLTGNVYEREIPGVRTEYLNKASAFKHFSPIPSLRSGISGTITFNPWPTISPSAWTNGKIRQKSILTPVPKSTKSKFRNRRKTKKQTGKEAKPQNIPFTTSYHSQFDINCFYKGVFHEHIPSFAVSPALAVFSVSAFIPMPSSADFFFRHRPPSFASLLLPKNTVQNVPAPAGNFRSQKGTLTQNRGYSYADILPHGTAKRLKGTKRPDKATILSATRKQV